MKTMKYVSMVMMIALFSVSLVNAQRGMQGNRLQGPPSEMGPEQMDKMVEKLSYELTLTEEQKVRFDKVFREHMTAMQEKREARQEDAMEERETSRADFEKELSGILNEAQMEKFKTIHPKKDRKKRGARKGGHKCRNAYERPCGR